MASNYLEIAGYGRGSGTDKPYAIAFELNVRNNEIADSIRGLSTKTGLAVKKIIGGGKPLSGFINITELNTMKTKVKYAQKKILQAVCNPSSVAAAEYTFRAGNFKGKTPSQLLLDGTSEADLLTQRAFLEKNATGKFAEANKKGMADIDAAIAKFKAGTLSASDTQSSTIKLFESGPRYFVLKKPQPYQTEGWELNITCNPGDKNPFSIEWQSKTVTIEKNVITSSKDAKSETAALTEVEFIDMWETLMSKLAVLENKDVVERVAYANAHKDDYKKNAPQGGNYQNYQNNGYSHTQYQQPKPAQTPQSRPTTNFSDDDEMPFH